MKILKFLKKIIIGIAIVIFFSFAIVMTILLLNYNDYGVTEFDNTSLILIKEEVSSDKYKKGDLVLVEKRRLQNISLGEEIFVYQVHPTGPASIDIGIIGEIVPEDNVIAFENGSAYSADFIIGESTKVYNGIGTYLSFIQSRWGFLFLILIPSFLIFVFQLYALILEIKYGHEDEETELKAAA